MTNLDTGDTNTDMRSLDHADVVRTVANGQCHCAYALLNQFDNERFLQWRDTTANDALALHGELQQQMFVLIIR